MCLKGIKILKEQEVSLWKDNLELLSSFVMMTILQKLRMNPEIVNVDVELEEKHLCNVFFKVVRVECSKNALINLTKIKIKINQKKNS